VEFSDGFRIQGSRMLHEITSSGQFTVVALRGEIDMSCSPEARKIILACLEESRPLLVDLSAVSYMDSSGVASLVEGLQLAKKRKLGFALVGTSQPVMNVLKLARLDRVFTLHDKLEEALV
jgi:anti-sigma B factor antagonist